MPLIDIIRNHYQQYAHLPSILPQLQRLPIEHYALPTLILRKQSDTSLDEPTHSNPIHRLSRNPPARSSSSSEHTIVELKKLFTDPRNKRILQLGDAGSGKTTSCQYITYQWSQHTLWQDRFNLILWIPLRELVHYQGASRLVDFLDWLIHDRWGLDNTEEITREHILTEWRQYNANHAKVLFILDGLDEAAHLLGQNTAQHNPASRMLTHLLKQAYLFVTSRPCYLNRVHVTFDQELENTGFSKEQIKTYITYCFRVNAQPEKGERLNKFLQTSPNLAETMHLPINLVLLCYVWNSNTNELETNATRTYLYTKIVHALKQRYLVKQGSAIDQLTRQQIQQYCDPLLSCLSSLAFTGLQSGELIISQQQLQHSLQQIECDTQNDPLTAVLNMGFIKPLGSKTGANATDYYFPHLTIQEFLTAMYVTHILKNTQHPKHQQILTFIQQNKYHKRYAIVWQFTTGLSAHHQSAMLRFWDVLEGKPRDLVGLKHIQLLILCLEEVDKSYELPHKKHILERVNHWVGISLTIEFPDKLDRLTGLYECLARAPKIRASIALENRLAHALTTGTPLTKRRACQYAKELNQDSLPIIQALIKALEDMDDQSIRQNACSTLGNLARNHNTTVIPLLLAALQHDNWRVRANILLALEQSEQHSESITKVIRTLINDDHLWVKYSAISALLKWDDGFIVTASMMECFFQNLEHPSHGIRNNAFRLLHKVIVDKKTFTTTYEPLKNFSFNEQKLTPELLLEIITPILYNETSYPHSRLLLQNAIGFMLHLIPFSSKVHTILLEAFKTISWGRKSIFVIGIMVSINSQLNINNTSSIPGIKKIIADIFDYLLSYLATMHEGDIRVNATYLVVILLKKVMASDTDLVPDTVINNVKRTLIQNLHDNDTDIQHVTAIGLMYADITSPEIKHILAEGALKSDHSRINNNTWTQILSLPITNNVTVYFQNNKKMLPMIVSQALIKSHAISIHDHALYIDGEQAIEQRTLSPEEQKRLIAELYVITTTFNLPDDAYQYYLGSHTTTMPSIASLTENTLHKLAKQGKTEQILQTINDESFAPETLNQQTKQTLETPLTIAAQYKHWTTARMLVKQGADINLRNNKQNTIIDLAQQQGNIEALVYLLEQRQSVSRNYLLRVIDSCLSQYKSGFQYQPSNRTILDQAMNRLVGIFDIRALINRERTVFIAHLNDWDGTFNSEDDIRLNRQARSFSGMHFSEFIRLRMYALFELLIKLRTHTISVRDLPDSLTIMTEVLISELLINLEMLEAHNNTEAICCFGWAGQHAEQQQCITAQTKNIVAKIAKLQSGDSYCYQSGFKQTTTHSVGHCLYVVFTRVGDNIIIQVDNVGDGSQQHHARNLSTLSTQTSQGQQQVTIKGKCPYFIGAYKVKNLVKNNAFNQYVAGIIRAQLGLNKQEALQLIYAGYRQRQSADVAKRYQWPYQKEQLIGNCTVRSHNIGLQIRFDTYYLWFRDREKQWISTQPNQINSHLDTPTSVGIAANPIQTRQPLHGGLFPDETQPISTIASNMPTHVNLMRRLAYCLHVNYQAVYNGTVVEQTLVNRAGITTDQSNALFRRTPDATTTFFQLNFANPLGCQIFLSYYQKQFPGLIQHPVISLPEHRWHITMDTVKLYTEVASFLGNQVTQMSPDAAPNKPELPTNRKSGKSNCLIM